MAAMDAKLNFDFRTNQRLIQKIGLLDGFNNRWEATVQKEGSYARALYKTAFTRRLAASLRLSGIEVSDDMVERRLKNPEPETLENQAIAGYREVLLLILEDHHEVPLTEKTLFELHKLLWKFSPEAEPTKGKYKTEPNEAAIFLPDGTRRVLFATDSPAQTGKALKKALKWYNEALDQKTLHPLLAIGAWVYEFACIHPFASGNGRLLRLLLNLMLLRNGYHFVAYAPLESILEKRGHDLARTLSEAHRQRGTKKETIGEWMLYLLECLESLAEQLETRYKPYQTAGHYLTDRQKQIKAYLQQNQPLKISDLEKGLPNISVHNMKKDLQQLVILNEVEKIGNYKSTIYIVKTQSANTPH